MSAGDIDDMVRDVVLRVQARSNGIEAAGVGSA
jgi:hypothetical protein